MTRQFIPFFFVLISLSGFSLESVGQTLDQKLQTGIQQYDEIHLFIKTFEEAYSDEVLDEIGTRTEDCIDNLLAVLTEGSPEQKRVGNYFMQMLIFEYGRVLSQAFDSEGALKVLKPIENSFMDFSPEDFPIEYSMPDGKRTIEWSWFEPSQAEFSMVMAITHIQIEQFEDAIKYLRQISSDQKSPLYLVASANAFLLDLKVLQPAVMTDEQHCQDVLNYLRAYDALSSEDRDIIELSDDFYLVLECMDILVEQCSIPSITPLAISYCAEAVTIGAKYETASLSVLQLYDICYQNYSSNAQLGLIYAFTPNLPAYEFSVNAEKYARNMVQIEKVMAEKVGLAATTRMSETAFDNTYRKQDCDKLSAVADNYHYWNQPEEEAKFRKLAQVCLTERDKADRIEGRKQRQGNSSFNLYTGIYIPQLIASNERRDYGGVLNLAGQKFGMEFSYLQVKQKKENIFDLWIREVDGSRQDNLSRWDGFYAHVQPKFIGKQGKGSYGYVGVLLGYSEKNFDPMNVPIVNDADGIQSAADFLPTVNQYILMVTYGAMILKKGFGADLFWSVGANYSNFNPGTAIDRNAFTILNPLLEGRKDSYFAFLMRIGLTMGINLGSGQ